MALICLIFGIVGRKRRWALFVSLSAFVYTVYRATYLLCRMTLKSFGRYSPFSLIENYIGALLAIAIVFGMIYMMQAFSQYEKEQFERPGLSGYHKAAAIVADLLAILAVIIILATAIKNGEVYNLYNRNTDALIFIIVGTAGSMIYAHKRKTPLVTLPIVAGIGLIAGINKYAVGYSHWLYPYIYCIGACFLLAALIPLIDQAVVLFNRKEVSAMSDRTLSNVPSKSKVTAALLAFFLGELGIHRYYLGYRKQGVIQTCGGVSLGIGYGIYAANAINYAYSIARGRYDAALSSPLMVLAMLLMAFGAITGIWALIDFIRILTDNLQPADGSPWLVPGAPQPQTAPQPAIAPHLQSAADGIELLERLAKLHEQGVLSDEEFQTKKAELLEKI